MSYEITAKEFIADCLKDDVLMKVLRENNAENRFFDNILRLSGEKKYANKKRSASEKILVSFCWNDSAEGIDFWASMQAKAIFA